MADALDRVARLADSAADYRLDEVKLLKPILRPGKTVCVGVNYLGRNAEYKDGTDAPKYPSMFFRTPGSLTGHGQPIVRPKASPQLDYEGEICLIIGKEGNAAYYARNFDVREISEATALALMEDMLTSADGARTEAK